MKIPKTVGIIMDGNRRFAKEKGLPSLEGHRLGAEKLKEVARFAREMGIENTIVFAFSSENWSRSKEEVSYLMKLFKEFFSKKLDDFKKEGGRVRFVGEISRFDKDIQEIIRKVEKETSGGKNTLWTALSYGGRAEIVQAARRLVEKGVKPEDISEESFSKELWTADMPDPDIIIRTSGEKRLSGFLPWQGVYSELFFVDTYWPAFSKKEFEEIIKQYGERQRRFGA